MATRAVAVAVLTVSALFAAPVAAGAAPSRPATSCTHTKSGTCIKAGEFCPKASNGKKGVDAKGRVYVCKAGHWRKG